MTAINSFVDHNLWNHWVIWQELLDALEIYFARMDRRE